MVLDNAIGYTGKVSGFGANWLRLQLHLAAVGVDNPNQFDNGVVGADRRFGVVRRDEVFITRRIRRS